MILAILLSVYTLVTGYVPAIGGINCDYECNVTASGLPPQAYTAACGPRWDLGDVLWVDGRAVVCTDRFGRPPDDYAVDLWFASIDELVEWGGLKWLHVQWLGQVTLKSGFKIQAVRLGEDWMEYSRTPRGEVP